MPGLYYGSCLCGQIRYQVEAFCSCCGSSLTLRSQPETLELALGSLDDEFAA